MSELVYFRYTIEEDNDQREQYGILLDDENILCLCCGSIVEKDEYEIIQEHKWFNFSQAMKDGAI